MNILTHLSVGETAVTVGEDVAGMHTGIVTTANIGDATSETGATGSYGGTTGTTASAL